MVPGLKHLVRLQAVDLRLAGLRDRLSRFPARIAEASARVETIRGQLAAAREALVGSLKDRKKYELDVEQWKERARKYKDQSYEVKTNEAYRALQHEIQNAEGEVEKAEDRLLERMVAGEEYERQVKTAERALAEAETAAGAERRKIAAEQAATQEELEAAEAERAEAAAGVPEELLELYYRIAKRRNGIGLAEARNQSCAQCGVMIPPHVIQELARQDAQDIFHCEACARILYLPQASAGAASAAAGSTPATGQEA
ncbi:MAG: zinc ribbon domain-containing protein [Candidatus Acidiferrales bacterium]